MLSKLRDILVTSNKCSVVLVTFKARFPILFIRGAVALGSSLTIVRRLLPSTASSFVLAIESFRPQHVRSVWSRHVDCFRLLAFGIVHVEFHLFALSC